MIKISNVLVFNLMYYISITLLSSLSFTLILFFDVYIFLIIIIILIHVYATESIQHDHEKRLRSLRQEHEKVKLKYMEVVNNLQQQQQQQQQQQVPSKTLHDIVDNGSVSSNNGSSIEKVAHTSPHLVNTRENSAQRIRYIMIIVVILFYF